MIDRDRAGEREQGDGALRLGVQVNALLAALKLAGGALASSPSLLADGYHSLGDTATNGVAWVGFRLGSRPPDEDHHYGHGKAEAAAAFFVGLVLALAGLVVLGAATRGHSPVYRGFQGGVALLVALVSVVANEWLVKVARTAARDLHSPSLHALARDNRSDSLSSLLVIIGVGASLAGAGWVEILATAVIGVFITVMGLKSLREGFDTLMDRVPDLGLRERARELAQEVEGVLGVQRVDIHPLGSRVRLDVEISVDGDSTVRKGHAIAHEVEHAVTREAVEVVEVAVHVNPWSDGTEEPHEGV